MHTGLAETLAKTRRRGSVKVIHPFSTRNSFFENWKQRISLDYGFQLLFRWASRSPCHARPQTTSNVVYRWRRWQEGDPVPS
ncbi:unnamed protein product, partial [Amoebophrya sp. A120]|eukprot:GSA120T00025503001.1